ncbi:DNA cytosine methyltransferase [Microvirga tunisiensis]|uniref:DNA (cytosine-5-)-methyltransferase n=1 Tax=Microvirga tunisiensis TaxID=2108360 RepID=A0A5N7MPY8_9HYPH|nr:DNA cytosine methyltransferase [Microvirga tunisiensis]MPR06211.1 DNA cytosine methyltransferase [Microvirga tunisiensis]MPR26046.1 DNA cytosine methyltransferase [Microvirga tunisiensis]
MRVVELFCGAGGMGLGLKRAGFRIVRAYDESRPALAVHRANLSPRLALVPGHTHTWVGDLGDLVRAAPGVAVLAPDLIAGGPPCQEFSQANRDRQEGDLADLTTAFAIIVATSRPRYFIMENVRGARKSAAYRRARVVFKRAGYGLTETILDATRYGVATTRKRLFLIGCLHEVDGFLADHLKAASDKRKLCVSDVLGAEFGLNVGDGRGNLYWFAPGGEGSPGTRRTDRPCPTITSSSPWAPGEDYVPRKGDVADVRRLPVPTLDQFGWLQGFPKDWSWDACGGKTNIGQMIANSVPPPVSEVVGRCILAHARGERPDVDHQFPPYFDRWLKEQDYPIRRLYDLKAAFRTVQHHLGAAATGPLETALGLLDRASVMADASPQRRSNLRKALCLHAECVDEFIRDRRPPFDGRVRRRRSVATQDDVGLAEEPVHGDRPGESP